VNGESALAFLLDVLRDLRSPEDAQHAELDRLAREGRRAVPPSSIHIQDQKTSPAAPVSTRLPPDLYSRLRAVRLQCDEFDSDASLHILFVVSERARYRDELPQADNRAARVGNTITFLADRSVNGEPVLARLLDVLSDRRDPQDVLHGELNALAREVRTGLTSTRATSAALASGLRWLLPHVAINSVTADADGVRAEFAGAHHCRTTRPTAPRVGGGPTRTGDPRKPARGGVVRGPNGNKGEPQMESAANSGRGPRWHGWPSFVAGGHSMVVYGTARRVLAHPFAVS
jgi:hypothetical protein